MTGSPVIAWFVIGCLFLFACPAAAGEDVFIPVDAGVLTFNIGWTTAENEATSKTADGASFQFAADWVMTRPYLSIGVSVSRLHQHEETEGIRDNLDTTPIFVTAKYWLGKEGSRVYGYAGVGVGGYNSTLESLDQTTDDFRRDQKSGFAVGVPVGIAVFISKRVALTASYQFNWLNKSFYTNDIAHVVLLGAGITIGIGD